LANPRTTLGPRRSTPPPGREDERIAQRFRAGGAGGCGPGGAVVVTSAQHVTGASSDQVPTYARLCARRGDRVTRCTCCPFPARTPAVARTAPPTTRLASNATTGNYHITPRPLRSGCRKPPILSSDVSRQAHCMKAHTSMDIPVSRRPTARQRESNVRRWRGRPGLAVWFRRHSQGHPPTRSLLLGMQSPSEVSSVEPERPAVSSFDTTSASSFSPGVAPSTGLTSPAARVALASAIGEFFFPMRM